MVIHVMASRVTMVICGTTSIFIMLHLLPPNLYGEFSFSASLLIMVGQLARMGMHSVVLKRFVKDSNFHGFWFGSYFVNYILINLLLSIPVITYLYFVNDTLTVFFSVLAILGCVIRPNLLLEPFLQGRGKFHLLSEFSIVYSIICLIVKALLAYFNPHIIYVSFLVELIVFSLYVYIRCPEAIKKYTSKKNFSINYKLFYAALPFAVSAIFYILNSRIDQIIIRQYGNDSSLAIYMLFIKLAEILSVFSMSICVVITTMALKEFKEKGNFLNSIKLYYKYNISILILAVLAAFVFPKNWFIAIVGEFYEEVFQWRFLLIAMYVMYSLTQLFGMVVLVRGMQTLAAWRSGLCFLLNIPIYIISYFQAGAFGLIMAVIISNVMLSVVFYSSARKTRVVISDLFLRQV